MHDREAQLTRELDRLGAAGEHRLGSHVDPDPGDLTGEQLPAHPGRALEHQDRAAGRSEGPRSCQTGDAGADDDRPAGPRQGRRHGSSLSPGDPAAEPRTPRPRRTAMRPSRIAPVAAAAAAALLLLTACSGGSGGDAATSDTGLAAGGSAAQGAGDAAAAVPSPANAPEAAADADAGKAYRADQAVDLSTQQQALIRTGTVALRSDDVGKTRYDVQVLVDEHDGQVADDKTETDKSGSPLRSRMVLRVPVGDFDEVMTSLAGLAQLASTTTSSEDVTTQLIDVEARIEVQTRSVQRVRQLLAQAASIRDIMAIEAELSDRQAELDSLTQQQAYLKDQTSFSTVKVNIERKPSATAAPTKDDDSGFLAGLAAGWHGLKSTVVAVATVVGALLPFALLALLLGVPAWILVRRIRRTPPALVAPGPESTP